MTEPKLTEVEERVLTALYHAKKRDEIGEAAKIAQEVGVTEDEVLKALGRLQVLGMVAKTTEFSLDAVDAALRQLDDKADCDTASRVLMASILIGSGDEERICRLGLDPDEVRRIGDRYRRNGVWDAGGVTEPVDDLEFWIMSGIGEGLMTREYNRDKQEWMYSLTDAGRKKGANMIGRGAD